MIIIEFLVKNTVGIMCVLVYNGHNNIVNGQKRNQWWGLSSLNFYVIIDEIFGSKSWFLLYASDNIRVLIWHKCFKWMYIFTKQFEVAVRVWRTIKKTLTLILRHQSAISSGLLNLYDWEFGLGTYI